jgi:biotin carboxyl carrier protein
MRTKNNRYIVIADGKKVPVEVNKGEIQKIGNKEHQISVRKVDTDEFIIEVDGRQHTGEIIRLKQNKCIVAVNGNTYSFEITTESAHQRTRKIKEKAANASLKLAAPLPGKIIDIMTDKGQKVKKGEAVLILEAMKMQNEIQSPVSGTIKSINVRPNESVMKDQSLMEIMPD